MDTPVIDMHNHVGRWGSFGVDDADSFLRNMNAAGVDRACVNCILYGDANRANVYLETCTSFGEHGAIEYLVESAGEDCVVFGSDLIMMDPAYQLARIVTADIPDEAKRKVLGLNAIKLLGLDL